EMVGFGRQLDAGAINWTLLHLSTQNLTGHLMSDFPWKALSSKIIDTRALVVVSNVLWDHFVLCANFSSLFP
ncbi:MAG: hypothetical protein DMG54_35935, partial [Acidobacteria bacterium]